MLEVWYPDKATFERTSVELAAPEVAAEIAADEDKLFDRDKNAFFYVDESESELVPLVS